MEFEIFVLNFFFLLLYETDKNEKLYIRTSRSTTAQLVSTVTVSKNEKF